ncbi:MAG: hypothetical protein WA304_02195 [Candidatus Cybelea sp.]
MNPVAGLTYVSGSPQGKLYGTTENGGATGNGTVFFLSVNSCYGEGCCTVFSLSP